MHYEQKKFAKAIEYYRRALEQRPDMAEALNNLGNALRMTGDIDGAIQAYQDALVDRAVYPEAYNNLGTLLQLDRKLDEAEHALRKAIQQNPRYVEAHNNLAQLLFSQKKEVEALRVLGEALKFAPKNVQTLLLTSKIQTSPQQPSRRRAGIRLAVQQEPENPEALTIFGQVLHETDRYDEAIEVLEKAIGRTTRQTRSDQLLRRCAEVGRPPGRGARAHPEGAQAQQRACTAPTPTSTTWSISPKGSAKSCSTGWKRSSNRSKNPEAEPFLPLHFAYAKALDDRGEHEKALEHYIIGGKMKRSSSTIRKARRSAFSTASAQPSRRKSSKTANARASTTSAPCSSSACRDRVRPWSSRSCRATRTSMAPAKSNISAARSGKLRDRFPSLPRYPDMVEKITPAQLEIVAKNYQALIAKGAGDAKRITDKLLTNYFFLGLINLLFPNAKVIHTQRDPVDTCLSGFTKLFKDDMPHSYDLGELGRYYGKYRELMEHWEKVLPEGLPDTVIYEESSPTPRRKPSA